MSTSQARNGGCLWAGQYFVPTEEIERQYPWGAPETGAENPATNQSTQTKGAIDYLLIERIVEGDGNEIVKEFKCSEVPRLTGRRLFFDPCRKAPEVPSQDR